MTEIDLTSLGRVDDEGNVYLIEGETERHIGQYLGDSAAEALAFYRRKYDDLEAQISLLEQRVRAGAKGHNLASVHAKLVESVPSADALGDLSALTLRLEQLAEPIETLAKEQSEAAKQAVADALAARTILVEEMETLLQTTTENPKWKEVSLKLNDLLTEWKRQQQELARIPKSEADKLWQRFRSARSTIESAKRTFFSELDSRHKQSKDQKQRLIEQAEALASKGAAAVGDYRKLLDQWKLAGRSGRRDDDNLWAKFKAAGDVLYAAKAEIESIENAEYSANLDAKQQLLDEYAALNDETDLSKLKPKWLEFLAKWDNFGRVPRDAAKKVDDQFRKLEQHLKKLEQDDWVTNNPETKARTEGLSSQLQDLISRLEADLAAAKAKKDSAAVKELEEAIQTRKAWLSAIS